MNKKERINAKNYLLFEKEIEISNILKTLRVLKKSLMTKADWAKNFTKYSSQNFVEDSDSFSSDPDEEKEK